MPEEVEKTLHLPCRLGEMTFWNPALRLWVYQAGLFDEAREADIAARVADRARARDGAFLNTLIEVGPAGISFRHGFLRYVAGPNVRHVVDLSASFDAYMAGFTAKTRSTLRRKSRRFARESGGSLDVREYRRASDMDAFFAGAREVSVRSYQERMLDAGLPATGSFRAELHDEAEQGLCRGYLLFLGDRPAAYLYCPVRDGVARYAYVGYDQELAGLSPGTVLLLDVLERLHAEPEIHTFDFLEGGGQDSHKAFFANRELQRSNVFLLRPRPRNIVVVLVHAASGHVSRWASLVLEWVGLKERFRRMIRKVRLARA